MSSEEQINTTSTPVGSDDLAEQFVADELVRARKRLQMTQIVGTSAVVILCGVLIYITNGFASALSPAGAAEITTGIVRTQIDTRGPELSSQVQEQVTTMLDKAPDQLIESLPKYREALEQRFEEELRSHAKENTAKLTEALGKYLDEHEEEMKTVVEATADAESLKKLSPSFRATLKEFLAEKQANGESVQDQLTESLVKLKEVRAKVAHLATAQQLSPEEKRLRRAIGVITHTVTKANLEPLPLPKLALNTEESAEPAPVGNVSAPPASAAPVSGAISGRGTLGAPTPMGGPTSTHPAASAPSVGSPAPGGPAPAKPTDGFKK